MGKYIDTDAKLKPPCPFCGCKKQFIVDKSDEHDNLFILKDDEHRVKASWVEVHCHGCGLSIYSYGIDLDTALENVKKKWSNRTIKEK